MSEENRFEGQEKPQPRWQPLSRIDRRVAGVLIEKAKTTPAAYPMTVNAITSGCNQKSNRFPLMQLEPDEVEESLERLRHLGAVGQIEGHGRVEKYRHYLYDWFGVDKIELSVMAELLLRGPQTVGELRGRVSRMDPIADLAALQPILQNLKEKGLVLYLTPEGRGQVVTHALFTPAELEKIKEEYASGAKGQVPYEAQHDDDRASAVSASAPRASAADGLAVALEELRAQFAQLRAELDNLADLQHAAQDELQRLRKDLGA